MLIQLFNGGPVDNFVLDLEGGWGTDYYLGCSQSGKNKVAINLTFHFVQDMCYSSVETCDAAMFLDCNCIKKFTTMENPKCNTVLCDIYNGTHPSRHTFLKPFLKGKILRSGE